MAAAHAVAFSTPLSHSYFLKRGLSKLSTTLTRPCSRRSRFLASATNNKAVKVGFIGLGVMGLPMAANLGKSFPHLIVWNRSDKTSALQSALAETEAQVTAAASPADVVREADITFSMLSTPEAVRSVFHEGENAAIHGVQMGKSIVDCSTLQVEDMQYTARQVEERGGKFLEAPVSGSKVPAEQGSLIFLCGGDREVFDNAVTTEAFDRMGKKAFYLGQVGNGTKMKLVINQLMASMLASLGESIVLSEALELPVTDLLEILSLGAMNNPMFALKGPQMMKSTKSYSPNFPLEHAQKDMRFAQLLGDKHGLSLSVSSAANEWYKAAKGLGLGREDFAAVIESIRACSRAN